LCGCSVDTIRRYRRDGAFPNASRGGDEPNAPWRIPLADLVSAGLYEPAAPVPLTFAAPSVTTQEPTGFSNEQSELERLADAREQVAWLRAQNQHLLELIHDLTRSAGLPSRHLHPINERATA
jgi:hypothetical protein